LGILQKWELLNVDPRIFEILGSHLARVHALLRQIRAKRSSPVIRSRQNCYSFRPTPECGGYRVPCRELHCIEASQGWASLDRELAGSLPWTILTLEACPNRE
jgi:hypothetical protein